MEGGEEFVVCGKKWGDMVYSEEEKGGLVLIGRESALVICRKREGTLMVCERWGDTDALWREGSGSFQ